MSFSLPNTARSLGEGGAVSVIYDFSYGVLSPDFSGFNKKSRSTEGTGLPLQRNLKMLALYHLSVGGWGRSSLHSYGISMPCTHRADGPLPLGSGGESLAQQPGPRFPFSGDGCVVSAAGSCTTTAWPRLLACMGSLFWVSVPLLPYTLPLCWE